MEENSWINWIQDLGLLVIGALLGYLLSELATNRRNRKAEKDSWRAFNIELKLLKSDLKGQIDAVDGFIQSVKKRATEPIGIFFNGQHVFPDTIDKRLVSAYSLRVEGVKSYEKLRDKFHAVSIIEYEAARIDELVRSLNAESKTIVIDATHSIADLTFMFADYFQKHGVNGSYENEMNNLIGEQIGGISAGKDIFTIQEKLLIPMLEINIKYPNHPLADKSNSLAAQCSMKVSTLIHFLEGVVSTATIIKKGFESAYVQLYAKVD